MPRIFDAHCDTIFELREKNLGLSKNNIHLDLERMSEFDTYVQIFAAFIDKKTIRRTPMHECLCLIDKYHAELEKNKGLIHPIETAADLEKTKIGGLYSILSIEGGEALEGNISALKMYYKMGVRLITLTWNHANELADGICESRGGGLTEFGREAVSMMERMGIMIDVSHLSENGFWDVVECTKRPFVASHSCVKSICLHPRNLTDEQISAIIKRRGCIGINFYPEFLSNTKKCTADDICRHIEYILKLDGEDSVGLGSDFDGVSCLPGDVAGVSDIKNLISVMRSRKFSDNIIDKILFGNFYRVFYECLERSNQ